MDDVSDFLLIFLLGGVIAIGCLSSPSVECLEEIGKHLCEERNATFNGNNEFQVWCLDEEWREEKRMAFTDEEMEVCKKIGKTAVGWHEW